MRQICGGTNFRYDLVPEQKLRELYTPEEIAYFKKTGQALSYFWTKRPALPIEEKGKV